MYNLGYSLWVTVPLWDSWGCKEIKIRVDHTFYTVIDVKLSVTFHDVPPV